MIGYVLLFASSPLHFDDKTCDGLTDLGLIAVEELPWGPLWEHGLGYGFSRAAMGVSQ